MGDEDPTDDPDVGDGGDTAEKGTGERFSIPKVQVRPRKPPGAKESGFSAHYLSSLPVLPDKPGPYIPMPYIFRVPTDSKPIRVKNLLARSPPFHILLDHTIAVIWLLFGAEEYDCPLGIAQLQWALAFLKTIHTPQGNHPKDVEVCIEAIENILLDDYALLSKEVALLENLDGHVSYADGAFGSNVMVTKELPFSLNYAEMVRKQADVDELVGPQQSMTSIEAQEKLECLKKAAGVDSIEKLDSRSKEKAINVLKMWKTEQVEKIRGELKRLRSIEDKIQDIDRSYMGMMDGNNMESLYSGV